MTQQGDVRLFQTNDNGDVSIESGIIDMTGGLETTVYLSLFGANEDDDGRENNPLSWWGNSIETDKTKHYRGETQHLLRSIPAIPANLKRIEDAVLRDLAWLTANSIVSSITVELSMPSNNRIDILLTVKAEGEEQQFNFSENWRAYK